MNIIAVDPGKTVGVAVYRGGRFAGSSEHSRPDALDLVNTAAADLVVCESFIPRPGVRSWQPDALEIIGALRWIADHNGVEFILQSPADAKRFATNDKLATLGWRSPTPGGHADDAARHLLLACVRRGVIDPERFL